MVLGGLGVPFFQSSSEKSVLTGFTTANIIKTNCDGMSVSHAGSP